MLGEQLLGEGGVGEHALGAPVWQSSKLPRTRPYADIVSVRVRGHLQALDVAHAAIGVHEPRWRHAGQRRGSLRGPALPVSPDGCHQDTAKP